MVAISLSACGGGSSSDSGTEGNNSTSGTAQGWWQGYSSNGYASSFVVLENQQTWGIYYIGNTVYGAFKGTSAGTGSSFTSSNTFFNFSNRTISNTKFSGNVSPGQFATLYEYGTRTEFQGTYNNAYNAPASLQNITGSFTGWGMTASSAASTYTVTVASNGSMSANLPNCAVSGTISPRANGKGVFDVNTTFVGSGCAIGNGVTTSGIAVLDTSTGTNRLIALTTTANSEDGFFFNGEATGGPGQASSVPAQAAMSNWLKSAATYRFNAQYLTTDYWVYLGTSVIHKSSSSNQFAVFDHFGTVPYSVVNTSESWSNCGSRRNKNTMTNEYYTTGWSAPLGYELMSGSDPYNQYYGVYNVAPTIPVTLRVGDTGTLGTMNLYTESTKMYPAGTKVVTYSASQESTSTILFTLTFKMYDRANVLKFTTDEVFRVTTDGVATLLSVTTNYDGGQVFQLM